MTQRRANIGDSEWNEHLARKDLETRAAQRARNTHQNRRARELAEQKAREDAQIDKRNEFAYARQEWAAELEKERIDRKRRGIDPNAERMALAKVHRDEAAKTHDATLLTVETNRPDAIISGAHLAAQTRREHAAELASANSATGPKYRAAIEVRVDAAADYGSIGPNVKWKIPRSNVKDGPPRRLWPNKPARPVFCVRWERKMRPWRQRWRNRIVRSCAP